MSRNIIFALLTLCLSYLFIPPQPGYATPYLLNETFTTEDITDAALDGAASNCLEYCITGVCIWLVCTPYGCSISTTPQIAHYLPDLVVTAHKTPGDIPWEEAKEFYGQIAYKAVGLLSGIELPTYDGSSRHVNTTNEIQAEDETTKLEHENLFFKDVSAIGSPAAILKYTSSDGENNYICPTEVTVFEPYFLSEFDTTYWRRGAFTGPEIIYPSSFIPGLREVGKHIFNSWGPVHPRSGFVLANEEPKGAAVTAQRGVDIVTREHQPHIYNYSELQKSDEKSDRWQMLAPVQDEMCYTFGVDDDYAINRSSNGNYGWLYWSSHECCTPSAGILIATIDIEPICLTEEYEGGR